MTTTTISREQYAYAVDRVREADLDERVEVLLRDYRDLTGTYDKLVSIEMIEAVGWQYFPAFFAKCAELTRPGGAMFLQAIVIEDELYEAEKAARSFSNKHIFPGGCLPSQAVITRLSAKNGMRTEWTEEISALCAHARRLARSLQRRLAEPAATWLRRALRACGTSTSGRRRRVCRRRIRDCRSSSRRAEAGPSASSPAAAAAADGRQPRRRAPSAPMGGAGLEPATSDVNEHSFRLS